MALRVAAGLDFRKLQRARSVGELMLANPGKFFLLIGPSGPPPFGRWIKSSDEPNRVSLMNWRDGLN
jgi:hypothetical protein